MTLFLNTIAILGNSGLAVLQDTLVKNWIGPAFIIMMALFALKAFKDRAWAGFITLISVGIAAALLIYAAPLFFGESGSLTNVAKEKGNEVISSGFGGSAILTQGQAAWDYLTMVAIPSLLA